MLTIADEGQPQIMIMIMILIKIIIMIMIMILIMIIRSGGPLGLSIIGGSDHSCIPFGTGEQVQHFFTFFPSFFWHRRTGSTLFSPSSASLILLSSAPFQFFSLVIIVTIINHHIQLIV